MGSGSSRLGSRLSRSPVNRWKTRRLSSLICGGSSSHASAEMEDHPAELLSSSQQAHDLVAINEIQNSRMESSPIFDSVSECSSSKTEDGASSESNNSPDENACLECRSRNGEKCKNTKYYSKSKELVPCQENADTGPLDVASTSFKGQQPIDAVSINQESSLDSPVEINNSTSENCSDPEKTCSSSSPHHEHGDSFANVTSAVENRMGEPLGVQNSDADSAPVLSDSQVTLRSLADDPSHEASVTGSGFAMSDRHQERIIGSVLHVDVVSISSNILSSSSGDISNREARRNSRRLFWDAFSRRSSRRHIDSPTIVFSTEDADDLGSPDRWLLDFSGDLFEDGFGGESGYLGRSHGIYERRWNSGSEIWERLRGGFDENGRRTTFCASGLHPDGTCSCGSFLVAEESGTRASISRIVMLAEALFEVLDEIHRQPVPLSLSMVSVPAPESVVNALPLKSHKKANTAETGADVEQCYICLAEYEEGDKIRVLPCHHEYHMPCIDKWLKEIHGVCPLCRGDVYA
ncbi:PREDICTED: uncharacterized protein LOC104588534 [Nelumbo nucifera]|uniref:Uncharacterized protein LOC104588534 n=1 Tax=Nelumbo nucifera TaxID=4432 RepID=A0A1U7YWD6_NELNU|nr:PREDICTED: uncharacterized protein LOC104588534 [Nelumbo nucifera]